MGSVIKCPKCSGTHIQYMGNNKKGFSVGKAVGGTFLVGGIGSLAGFVGKKGKNQFLCSDCGYTWAQGEKETAKPLYQAPASSEKVESNSDETFGFLLRTLASIIFITSIIVLIFSPLIGGIGLVASILLFNIGGYIIKKSEDIEKKK